MLDAIKGLFVGHTSVGGLAEAMENWFNDTLLPHLKTLQDQITNLEPGGSEDFVARLEKVEGEVNSLTGTGITDAAAALATAQGDIVTLQATVATLQATVTALTPANSANATGQIGRTPVAGDACTTANGEAGVMTDDGTGTGALVCQVAA